MFRRAALIGCVYFLSHLSGTFAGQKVVLVAGGTEPAGGLPAVRTRLNGPFGIDFDTSGTGYLIELTGNRLFRMEAGLLTHIGGTGQAGRSGDGGPALHAEFNGMHNLAVGPDQRIYLADTWNHQIRVYDPQSKIVTTFAGTGKKGFAGDGEQAEAATFSGIYCVTLTPDHQQLLLADLDNRRIRAINLQSRLVCTIAGNGDKGIPADDTLATAAPLVDPRAVTADADGNVYLLERSGHALRVVSPSGHIRTVAGTGRAGHTGDDGPARAATLNGPKHLCVDRDGTVIIADTENHVIRRYSPQTGMIHRIAGTGRKGNAGIGLAPLSVELFQPHGVTIGPEGELYIVDSGNHRVLKIIED